MISGFLIGQMVVLMERLGSGDYTLVLKNNNCMIEELWIENHKVDPSDIGEYVVIFNDNKKTYDLRIILKSLSIEKNSAGKSVYKIRDKINYITGLPCELNIRLKMKRSGTICINHQTKYYENYLGVMTAYSYCDVTANSAIDIIYNNSKLYWSQKSRKRYYCLVESKNFILFLILSVCLYFQIKEGFTIGDEWAVWHSITGFQQAIINIVILIVFCSVFIYYSIRLFYEYKSMIN